MPVLFWFPIMMRLLGLVIALAPSVILLSGPKSPGLGSLILTCCCSIAGSVVLCKTKDKSSWLLNSLGLGIGFICINVVVAGFLGCAKGLSGL